MKATRFLAAICGIMAFQSTSTLAQTAYPLTPAELQQYRAAALAAEQQIKQTRSEGQPRQIENVLPAGNAGGATLGVPVAMYTGLQPAGNGFWSFGENVFYVLDDGRMGGTAAANGGGTVEEYEFAVGLNSDFAGDQLTPAVIVSFYHAPLDPVANATNPVVEPPAPQSSVLWVLPTQILPAAGEFVFRTGLIDLAAASVAPFYLNDSFYVEIIPLEFNSGNPVFDPDVHATFTGPGSISLGSNLDRFWFDYPIAPPASGVTPGNNNGFYENPAELNLGGNPPFLRQSPLRLAGTPCSGAPELILTSDATTQCLLPGEMITYTLSMRCLPELVRGYQAFLEFDDSALTFVSGSYIQPDPFDLPIIAPIAASGGQIDLAAGIDDAAGQLPTDAPSDLATMTFMVNAVPTEGATTLAFRTNNPPTRFTNAMGMALVPITTDAPDVLIDLTAPDIVVNVTGGSVDANCEFTVNFTATITDAVCIDAGTANVMVGALITGGNATIGVPTFMVNQDSPTQLTVTGSVLVSDLTSCPAEVVISVSADDCCGNMGSDMGMDDVVDDTDPMLVGVPADETLECDQPLPTPPTVTAPDNCDAGVMVMFNEVDNRTGCNGTGTVERTWSATDFCGNTTMQTQTITVVDTTPPMITCPMDVTVECDESTDPADTGMATAIDNCDGAPVITSSDAVVGGACPQESVITRTWTATDACGNSSSCDQIITVVDTTPPLLFCPADVTIECDESTDPMNTGMANFAQGFEMGRDGWLDFGGVLTRVMTGTNGVPSSSGSWHAETDGAFTRFGGYSSVWPTGGFKTCMDVYLDLTDPSVSTGNTYGWDISCAATGQDGNHRRDFIFHAASNAGGNILIGGSNNSNFTRRNDLASINNYEVTASGWYKFEWVFRDAGDGTLAVDLNLRDSSGTLLFTETRNDPSDIIATVVGGNRYGWVLFVEGAAAIPLDNTTLMNGNTMAFDNCDPDPTVTFSDVVTPGSCAQESTITRTWTATDACGNSSMCDQIITVVDTTPPVITCPADVTVECDASTDPMDTGSATAVDNCDGAPTITFADMSAPDACPNVAIITRTWTATDACGNMSTCDQTITLEDTTPPMITCPADVTIECDESTDPMNTGSATAMDNCDPAPMISSSDSVASGACPQEMVITRTWTATDACGNSSMCVQTITVEDTTAPTISAANISVLADAGGCDASVTLTASGVDNCGTVDPGAIVFTIDTDNNGFDGGDPTVVGSGSMFTFSSGTTNVQAAGDDECGNTGTTTFMVTVSATSELAVTVELANVSASITRCITFDLYDCAGLPVTVQADLMFVGGIASDTINVPCGDYDCIVARDELHTLARRIDRDDTTPGAFAVIGTQYVADFTDQSGGSGDDNSLIGGNLNDDPFIDILDFGIFAMQFGTFPPANTPCPPGALHADISGDGAVDTADFTFIQINFLMLSDPPCCLLATMPQPRTAIAVDELIDLGYAHLVPADLNEDGVLDQLDVAAFMNGARPIIPTVGKRLDDPSSTVPNRKR